VYHIEHEQTNKKMGEAWEQG